MNYETKLENFRALVQQHQTERMMAEGFETLLKNSPHYCDAKIVPGAKYDKVNVGTSGKFMVEKQTGRIFGIKAYGQIHRGHYYGTLDTTSEYFWGKYYPEKLDGSLGKQKANSCPVITEAPDADYEVFNPGVETKVSLTLEFQHPEDAAWVERCIAEGKRDGRLSPLMQGILFSSLKAVAHAPVVRVAGVQLTPGNLKDLRIGKPA
jgi:hypothetical protein